MIPKNPAYPYQHDGADPEVAVGKQPQVDHRVPIGHFPDHEDRQGDHRDQRADNDETGLEPIQVVALVEHDLQRPDPDDQAEQADVVHRLATGDHRPRLELLHHHPGGEQPDGDVDEEDPGPTVAVGDPAPRIGPAIGATTVTIASNARAIPVSPEGTRQSAGSGSLDKEDRPPLPAIPESPPARASRWKYHTGTRPARTAAWPR